MEWKSSYILVRPAQTGVLNIMHTAEKLKDARYWLQYIALPKDAIFTTPMHPKYQGSGDPSYMAHLVARGKIDYNADVWKKLAFNGSAPALSFVDGPPVSAAPSADGGGLVMKETQILELANGQPHNLSLEQLSAVLMCSTKKFEIVLSEPSKWIDWESALTLMTRDMYIISVDRNAKWPLTVTLKPKEGKGETMNYEADMRFVGRPRAF